MLRSVLLVFFSQPTCHSVMRSLRSRADVDMRLYEQAIQSARENGNAWNRYTNSIKIPILSRLNREV
jgi:hypothetical protein